MEIMVEPTGMWIGATAITTIATTTMGCILTILRVISIVIITNLNGHSNATTISKITFNLGDKINIINLNIIHLIHLIIWMDITLSIVACQIKCLDNNKCLCLHNHSILSKPYYRLKTHRIWTITTV